MKLFRETRVTRPDNASVIVLFEGPLQPGTLYLNMSGGYPIGFRILKLEVRTPSYRNYVYTEFKVVRPDTRP